MSIDSWKAAVNSRHFILRNGGHGIGSPGRLLIKNWYWLDYFKVRYNKERFNFRSNILNTRCNIAVINTDNELGLKLIQSTKSIDFAITQIEKNSVVAIKSEKINIFLLKEVELKKAKYLILMEELPAIIQTLENLPSDWQQGLISHSKVKIFLNKDLSLYGNLMKFYVSKWQKTLYLMTNDELNLNRINDIINILPIDYQ